MYTLYIYCFYVLHKKLYSRRFWGDFTFCRGQKGAGLLGHAAISKLVFHYYLLGGDTTVPSWLYAGLCHAFLVLNYCYAMLCCYV